MPATATARPPRKGPIKRHLSPFTSSGGTGWATAPAVSARKANVKIPRPKNDLSLRKVASPRLGPRWLRYYARVFDHPSIPSSIRRPKLLCAWLSGFNVQMHWNDALILFLILLAMISLLLLLLHRTAL